MPENIRLRFAPSPTGFLHIGSLRTVLFNYLAARNMGGQLILRIEDTDQKRKVPGAVENLLKTLAWLEIDFDEGPHIGGNFGPYVQSERQEIYQQYIKRLLDSGQAYYCFCSPDRLAQMRARQIKQKQPPRYDRTCRHLSAAEAEKRVKAGEKYVIRQKMPLDGEIVVRDELRGPIKFQASELEDHILMKSDGWPTYQLAVVVDDYLMKISHVVRGEEWIPSLPKNILLYQAFGWPAPKFYHMPLTLNKGGGKLSKRHGDVAVEDYQRQGYLPEALVNFCALLGWHPKDDREVLSRSELIKEFRLEDIGTSPAVFDIAKLDYLNGYYIRHKNIKELTQLCLPYLESAGFIERQGEKIINKFSGQPISLSFIAEVVKAEQERMKKLADISQLTEFFFNDDFDYQPVLLRWRKMELKDVKPRLEEVYGILAKIPAKNWTDDSIEDALLSHIKAVAGQVGEYLWPLRVALSGRPASPPPFVIAQILGKAKTLARLKKAIDKFN